MATFYLNHESELYHAYMAAYEEEFYGDDPSELYHYGRKGMRRGMHLPDIIDPTRELVGKVVPKAQRMANVYAKRISKYGTMAGKYLNKKYDQAVKAIDRKRRSRQAEAYEYEEFKKYKAEKAAKAKNKSLQDTSNRKAEASKATIDSLRKDLNAAIDAGDHDKVTSIRKAIEKAKRDEKNRIYREKARDADQYHSAHAGEAAMADFAKKQKLAQAKAKAKTEREKMKDPSYAQKKANQKASESAGIKGLETRQKLNDEYERQRSEQKKRYDEYMNTMLRDERERKEQEKRKRQDLEDRFRRLQESKKPRRGQTSARRF